MILLLLMFFPGLVLWLPYLFLLYAVMAAYTLAVVLAMLVLLPPVMGVIYGVERLREWVRR